MLTKHKDIRLISTENLSLILSKNNFPSYRSNQIKNWARKTDILKFEHMSNLPKELNNLLIMLRNTNK